MQVANAKLKPAAAAGIPLIVTRLFCAASLAGRSWTDPVKPPVVLISPRTCSIARRITNTIQLWYQALFCPSTSSLSASLWLPIQATHQPRNRSGPCHQQVRSGVLRNPAARSPPVLSELCPGQQRPLPILSTSHHSFVFFFGSTSTPVLARCSTPYSRAALLQLTASRRWLLSISISRGRSSPISAPSIRLLLRVRQLQRAPSISISSPLFTMGVSMSTLGGWTIILSIAGYYGLPLSQRGPGKGASEGRYPAPATRGSSEPPDQEGDQGKGKAATRGDAYSKDVDESDKAATSKPRAPKAPTPVQNVVYSSDDGVDNREFAKQLRASSRAPASMAPERASRRSKSQ